ncbi:MAG TPA: hypothetical protein VLI45_09175 [Acidobacteriaceae bacterium]|nr:hypothetical protein [Acidobacteriaceae bacterium]
MQPRFSLRRLATTLILGLGACLGSAPMVAQIPLTATNLKTVTGQPVTGNITICPVTDKGVPIAFNVAGGGTGLAACVQVPVTGGAFSTTVPDTYNTTPQNVCLAFSYQDPSNYTEDLPNYTCVQPSITTGSAAVTAGWCSTSSCNLDLFKTFTPNIPTQNMGGGTTIVNNPAFNGGTVTNAIVLPGDPTTDLQAADKHYVDNHAGTTFTGGTVPNATTFGSTVTLAADPTQALQPATKQYTDTKQPIGGVWQRLGTVFVGGARNQQTYQESSLLYHPDGNPAFWEAFETCGYTTAGICHFYGQDPMHMVPQNNGEPVIGPGFYHGRVKKFAGGNYYWIGQQYGVDPTSFTIAVSTDGQTWSILETGFIPQLGGTSWDSGQKGNIDWWVDSNGVWQFLYEALGSDGFWRVGRASGNTAGAPTAGYTATAYSGNPVISWGGYSGSNWAQGGMCGGARSTVQVSGAFYTWLHCDKYGLVAGVNGGTPTDVFRWKSSDSQQHVWTLDTPNGAVTRQSLDEGPTVTPGGPGQIGDFSIAQIDGVPSSINGVTYAYMSATDNQTPTPGDFNHIKLLAAPMTLAQLVTTQEGNAASLGFYTVGNPHLGTQPECWTQTQTLAAPAASIIFYAIPSCGHKLQFTCSGRTTSGASSWDLMLNGDAGSTNYGYALMVAANPGSSSYVGQSFNNGGFYPAGSLPGSAAPAGQMGTTDITIYDYTSPNIRKNIVSDSIRFDSDTTAGATARRDQGVWRNSTSGVYQVQFSPDAGAGNFDTNTTCTATAAW